MYHIISNVDGITYEWHMCASHVYLEEQDASVTIVPTTDDNHECAECVSQQASYEADLRAEWRNEQYFHFGHANY